MDITSILVLGTVRRDEAISKREAVILFKGLVARKVATEFTLDDVTIIDSNDKTHFMEAVYSYK